MKEADDFREVCRQVDDLLGSLEDGDFERPTDFKNWTIDEILRHLHVWNIAAKVSLTEPDKFSGFWEAAMPHIRQGRGRTFEADFCDGQSGHQLRSTWFNFAIQLADAFAEIDPKQRVKWVGPSMSARSSITARLMETWSHAQAIYDELGINRPPTDAIENIVALGINTYGWTFKNRGEDVPEPRPQLVLTMPSGEVQTFGDVAGAERIEGTAHEFCQVVTQCRNIADTSMIVTGENAQAWMGMAQCFAGPPQDPPAPGMRAKRS